MKFLNLETGYTFDGIWDKWMSWSEWEVNNFRSLKDIVYSESTDYLFSYTHDNDDPITNPSNWTTQLDSGVKRYAVRHRTLQSKGYIFWFPGEQSIGITYTMPICIIADNETLNIEIEENNVFHLIEKEGYSKEHTIHEVDGYKFVEPEYEKTITSTSTQSISKADGTKYIHIFNVVCCGSAVGEYICKITITSEDPESEPKYIRVGADLYGEYEPSYINLLNMGVELPDMIQKAVYEVDVHEDVKDNIIINRKLKELLSNYWDVVANKGSYKSLVNSLEWFEWSDILKIKEIWKHYDANLVVFDDRDMLSLFESKITDTYKNFVKTTYISLYCALYEEQPSYDNESNPEIKAALLKWSREEIQLKMSLLSQFFGAYFLPIHMSILHATVEDIVFTNTIKTIHGAASSRTDMFGDFVPVDCNISYDDVFMITNEMVAADKDTLFVYDGNEITPNACNLCGDYSQLGVKDLNETTINNESELLLFAKNYYVGPGVVIPIKLTIPNQQSNDFVKHTFVNVIRKKKNNGVETICNHKYTFYNVFNVDTKTNTIHIDFNIIAKFEGDYTIGFIFTLASGNVIDKQIKFKVEDTTNLDINIYRVCHKEKGNATGFDSNDFMDASCSKYIFKIQPNNNQKYYTQYLPYCPQNLISAKFGDAYKGIKLNRTIVVDTHTKAISKKDFKTFRSEMQKNFLEFERKKNNEITYLVYVSKRFYDDTKISIPNGLQVIRDEYGFYPQFHTVEKIASSNSINDYVITQYDAICCAPEFNDGKKVLPFKYGNYIETNEWSFTNSSINNIIELTHSSQVPFIADTQNKYLQQGYYNIKFNYALTNGDTYTCERNNAFIVKHI